MLIPATQWFRTLERHLGAMAQPLTRTRLAMLSMEAEVRQRQQTFRHRPSARKGKAPQAGQRGQPARMAHAPPPHSCRGPEGDQPARTPLCCTAGSRTPCPVTAPRRLRSFAPVSGSRSSTLPWRSRFFRSPCSWPSRGPAWVLPFVSGSGTTGATLPRPRRVSPAPWSGRACSGSVSSRSARSRFPTARSTSRRWPCPSEDFSMWLTCPSSSDRGALTQGRGGCPKQGEPFSVSPGEPPLDRTRRVG